MARITVKDVREAIEGMADDDPVALDMADPPDDYSYAIDGIANYGGTLQISVSEADDEEDDEDEDEVEVPGGFVQWDDTDGSIRFQDEHGNTPMIWRPGDAEYEDKRTTYFPDHVVPSGDDEDDDEDDQEEQNYAVTFIAVQWGTKAAAVEEARQTISHPDFEPVKVEPAG